MWAADPGAGTVGTIAGAAAQASYAFDTVLGENVSNAEVLGLSALGPDVRWDRGQGHSTVTSCVSAAICHTMKSPLKK